MVRIISSSIVLSSFAHTYALWLQVQAFCPSLHPWSYPRVRSLHFDSPSLLLALPSALFLFLNYMKSMVNLHNSCNEGVDASDDLLLSTKLADQLQSLFPDADDEGAFIITSLDTHSQIFSIEDRRNGVGKPVSKLALFGSRQLFTFVSPDLFYCLLLKCCNRVSLKPTRPMCEGCLFASSPSCRLAS